MRDESSISEFLKKVKNRLDEVENSIRMTVETDAQFEASKDVVSSKLRENANRVVNRTFYVFFPHSMCECVIWIISVSFFESINILILLYVNIRILPVQKTR